MREEQTGTETQRTRQLFEVPLVIWLGLVVGQLEAVSTSIGPLLRRQTLGQPVVPAHQGSAHRMPTEEWSEQKTDDD